MLQLRWFKILRSLGLEFWLSLPLLGLALWVGSGFVTNGILSRSNQTAKYLKVDAKSAKPKITVQSIKAEINKRQGVSRVTVKTTSSALQELEFEFPVTELNQLEAAISQELGLPVEEVKKRLDNSKGDSLYLAP